MSFWTAVATFFKDAKIAWDAASTLKKISYVFQAVTAVVGVKGFMQAKQMMAKGQDILANKTAAGGKLPVIYGTRRVGAQVVYMDVSANDSRDLYVVYALSVGECDEIIGRTIELDGNPLTDSARFRDGGYIGSDKISSGSGSLNTVSQNGTGIDAGAGQFGTSPTSRYRYVMNLHHGAATQTADPMLVASMPNWTTAHKLNGVTYIAAHYGYDKEGIWSGVPQLTVQVRGKKVFDPRDTNQIFGDVSTYKYSDNPALTFLDYITNNEYGKGLTQSQINMSTFTAAANVCDTKVDQPYFNGSTQSLTWSGNVGDDFITIGGTDPDSAWWQNKVGEVIDIRDGSNTLIVDGKEIKDVQRNGFYDQNNEYIVYINDTLGSTYSSQAGTSLVKVKRFHCNGYLDSNKNVMDNAKELLANMRGIFLYIDGKYELSIEDTGSATFNITDDHIISDAGISVDYGDKDKKANKVIVEFFNANKKYELDTATVLHDASPEYYSDDGDEILEIKAEFPYVTDPYIAYNMAKAILVRSRKQMTIQFLGTPEMYKLNVGDIVTLSYVGTFDTVQTCRVEALELQSNGLVSVSLIEYFDVYTWETPPEEPLEELANLPSAYAVKAPTGLSFTDTDSSSTGRPFLSWNEPTDFPDYQYRVNVVDSSGNQVINRIVDVENCDLNFVPTGSYVASVTSLNTLGTESNPARFPTTGTFTIGDAPAGTPDIKDDAITTPKILNNNVTDAKINSLTANKLTAGTIDASVITVTNLDADNITSGTIGADKIVVDDLSAINSDLGDIDAGSLNIGSGAFTVSTAGVISATSGEVGGFTLGSTSLTNTAADSKIQIGSGSDVFTVDGDGIYLGNTSFASAPFKALNTGEVQTTKSFTAGVAGSGEIAKMAGTGDYRFWSGNEAPANASFSVDKAGKVIAKNLVLKLTDGTVYFDSQTGFSDSALSQISLTTGTKVSTVSNTFDADTEYEEITVTENTDVNVSVSIDANFGGNSDDSSTNTAIDESEAEVPENFTLTIQHSSDGGANYSTVVTDTFTRVNDRVNPKTTPASDEYKINTETEQLFIGGQGGVIIIATTTTSLNLGCVDSDGRTILAFTGLTLTGISTGTTHRIKATVSTTDTSYDTTNNNVSSTAPRVVSITDPSGDGFYVGDGSGSTVAPAGDITRVQITTASNSGLTGGANFASGDALFTLALGSTFAGNKTFSNNVVIQGNLDVQGTTTTIDTTNLDVKDKNITLNYGTGDTSANANGAGFTIQDAVSAGNDASLTWTTANNTFNLSHPLSITGALTLNNTAISGVNQLAFNDPGVNEGIEWTGGNIKIFESPDNLTNAAGNLQVVWSGTRRLTVNNSGIDVNGTINSGSITSSGNLHAGDGTNISMDSSANGQLEVDGNGYQGAIALDGNAMHLYHNSSARSLVLGTNETARLTIGGSGGATLESGVFVIKNAATDSSGLRIFQDTSDAAKIYNNYNGTLQLGVGNTTALTIDSSENATFAGTISSGAITAPSISNSGTVTVNNTGTGVTLTVNRVSGNPNIKAGTDDSGYLIMDSSGASAALNWYTSNNVILAFGGGKVGVGDNTPTQKLDVNGNIGIGGTEIITSGRNLTNIGTISATGISTGANLIDLFSNQNGVNDLRLDNNRQDLSNVAVSKVSGRNGVEVANMTFYRGGGGASGFIRFQNKPTNASSLTDVFQVGDGGTVGYGVNIMNGGLRIANTTAIDSSRNLTNIGTISSGGISSTGFITGTRLRVGDGNDGYFYSDTNGRTAFSSGEFYIQTSVPNFYNYATNQYYGGASGDTIHFRGNVITADNWGIPSSGTITSTGIRTSTNQARVKLGVWSDNTYGIGMQTGYTFGGLNNDYAMTFQMNNDNDRGFWWGDSTHTNAQGAMALTTNGLLTVASGIRVGYGETDTTIPSAGLDVNGTISSGAITASSSINLTAGKYKLRNTVALDHDGNSLYIKAPILVYFEIGTTNVGNLNGAGRLNLKSYQVNGTTVIDTSRNLTNIGTISSGTIDLLSTGPTADKRIHIPRSGGITFYGDTSTNHSIFARDRNFTAADDLRINSYGALYINLDSNSNNSSGADLVVGRHGGSSAMATSQDLLVVNGENGNVNIAYDNACLTFGIPSNGANAQSCWASMEGNTDTSGEGSGRLFFREHNSSVAAGDNFGMSLGYRGGATSVTTALGNQWTGLSQIGNGQWGMWGHNGDATGALVMSGDRAATFIDFHLNNLNNILGVTSHSFYGNSNSARLSANTVTSYATWKTSGSKGGYDGIMFDDGGNMACMWDSAGNGGFYQQGGAGWTQYFNTSNSCTAFGASTTSASYEIYVHGAIYATGNITAYSDRRIKENISTIDKPLTKVEALRGVYYNKIDDTDKTKQIGFIAQEVDEVVPELVTYAEDVDQYGVNYGNATALLVEAVKELSQQVKDQQKQIDELKQRLDNDSCN